MIVGMRAAVGRVLAGALAAATVAAAPVAAHATGHAPARLDQVRAGQWYLETMGVVEAHKITQGEGQVIAVIDEGVNPRFPDLAGSVLPGVDTWTPEGKGWVTDDGHGTAVAAAAAGHGHGAGRGDGILGIAPKAKILPMGVWPPGQRGSRATDIATSIRYVVDHGATVICVAGGGSGNDELHAAVQYAYRRGVPVIGGAGNRPDDATIVAPAEYRETLAISGLDRRGNFARNTSVSAFGVDFAAPAEDIPAPKKDGSGYESADGTSGSAAIAAGAVALLRDRYPSLSAEQIFQHLKATAVDKGKPGYDIEYGWGALDLLAALTTEPATGSTATPRSTFTPPPPIAADEGLSLGARLAITVAAVAGFLLVVGGLTALVVRGFVRRRRGRAPA